jgi:hypothetical protein
MTWARIRRLLRRGEHPPRNDIANKEEYEYFNNDQGYTGYYAAGCGGGWGCAEDFAVNVDVVFEDFR